MENFIRDNYQNYKPYGIPKAQLIIGDVPYNLGVNAYASNPAWYKNGDNKNGESALAGKSFFNTDENFKPAEFMHFASTMLKAESKKNKKEIDEQETESDLGDDNKKRQKSNSPCMILFCAFHQQMDLIALAKRYGLNRYINLVFRKNFSAQVLKSNMKVVGNCEYGLILYRDRLPKFNNIGADGKGKMIFNCMDWEVDEKSEREKIHPTQKPVKLLKRLIEIFTDEGDVVIDPCAGSGSTIVAAEALNRKAYGFEIDRKFHAEATKWILKERKNREDEKAFGFRKTQMEKQAGLMTLWGQI